MREAGSRGYAGVIAIAALLALLPARQASAQTPAFDVVVLGGTVVDGTGAARYVADVGIRGDRIARIARDGIPAADGKIVLDARNLIVAPGFIDNHAHIQTSIHAYPLAENFTRQGITTILASLHSGAQAFPLDEYAASLRVVPNVGFFTGHSWVRERVLGLANRAPTTAELEQMRQLVDASMRQGALGLSTGLVYVPANYARTEEVIELAKIAARHGGRIHEGAFADITVFDAETIQDRATYLDPHQYPAGIHHVVVNGVPVIRDGALTGERPGRVLRGPARPAALRSDAATPAPRSVRARGGASW